MDVARSRRTARPLSPLRLAEGWPGSSIRGTSGPAKEKVQIESGTNSPRRGRHGRRLIRFRAASGGAKDISCGQVAGGQALRQQLSLRTLACTEVVTGGFEQSARGPCRQKARSVIPCGSIPLFSTRPVNPPKNLPVTFRRFQLLARRSPCRYGRKTWWKRMTGKLVRH